MAAYTTAPASFVAPFEYTAILWSIGLGFVIWGDVPNLPVYVGAGLVVVAGLVVARAR
jgi:drug/metabolite transporter (DMT)-like permease